VRKRQEEMRARALADAQRAVDRAERELEDLHAKQREMLDEAGRRAVKRFEAREVRLYYQYERHVAQRADNKSAEILELRAIAEGKRVELEEALKRRRMMEKLIEKKWQGYGAELRKEEQIFADEIAVQRAHVARIGRRAVRKPWRLTVAPEPAEAEIERLP
jgi:flagellar export protein FliJ